MKVNCPHCRANYEIDDRRIPASGLNVKCPKCAKSFPVRREPEPPPPPPVEEPFSFDPQEGSIPLPAPENPFALPPPEFVEEPFAFEGPQGSIALPPPENPFALPPPADASSPFEQG
ncbi:MAG: zinc-ribbon domain-containing protein, partial [Anaeromyxobacteraceae bacterium]